jgi:hypothetical protein
MKTIQAVQIWDNGQMKEAKVLNTYGINQILGVQSTFYYSLSTENIDGSLGSQTAQGNLTMDGQDYQNYGSSDDYVWNWVAGKLNLTITGDYVPPVENQDN